MEKVNYLGMRRMLERSGNRDELDRMIINYLNGENIAADSIDPVLREIRLQESTINSLSVKSARTLLLNGAIPSQTLIERIIKSKKYDDLFFLFEHKFINLVIFEHNISEFCRVASLNDFFDMCETMVMNPERFSEFHFEELEKVFRARVHKVTSTGFIWAKILKICFQFMRLLSGEDHMPMINTVFACIRDKQENLDRKLKSDLEKQMRDFIQEEVFSKKSGNDLIETMNICKYRTVLLSNPLIALRCFFQTGENDTYDSTVNDIFELICDGKNR